MRHAGQHEGVLHVDHEQGGLARVEIVEDVSRPRRATTRSVTDCGMENLCMANPSLPDAGLCRGPQASGQRRRDHYSLQDLSKIKEMHPTLEQIAARQAAWKPSKKEVSGRLPNVKNAAK